MNPMKVKWHHSITVKIFVAVCLLLTAALFTSTAVNIYRSYNQLHLQAQERTLQEANASADYAKSTINSILSTMKVLAVSYGMQGRSSYNATAQLMQQVL